MIREFLLGCDRCHNIVKVAKSENFTSGYYEVVYWTQFANAGENYVCDWCIHTDARYIKSYGPTAESKHKEALS